LPTLVRINLFQDKNSTGFIFNRCSEQAAFRTALEADIRPDGFKIYMPLSGNCLEWTASSNL